MSGVFILGMHRSGTSAVARMVNLLGVPLCVESDLMLGYGDNPLGHWESESLATLNEQLLHLAHAAWDCPPAAEEPWLGDALWSETLRARAAFEAVHPTSQWAWKDPRLCILLPFWRRALPGPHSAILIVRHPVEIAASLAQRDRLAPTHVLAMWERYVRLALIGCNGMPVLVIDYDDVLDDPSRACAGVAAFLRESGVSINGHRGDASACIRAELRHHRHSRLSQYSLTREQQALLALLHGLKGARRSFAAVSLPPESPTIVTTIDSLRPHWGYTPESGDADKPSVRGGFVVVGGDSL
jgi:hypothetical protein